jgi:hypothetical protein
VPQMVFCVLDLLLDPLADGQQRFGSTLHVLLRVIRLALALFLAQFLQLDQCDDYRGLRVE